MHHKLSVITVTYNSANEIDDFVKSLEEQSIDYDAWLIDNASTDDTQKKLIDIQLKNKNINIILNEKNIGLSAANNQPIKKLNSEYIAIINPDVKLHKDSLSKLINYLDTHQNAVAVAPVNVDYNGEPHSSFHRSWSLIHLMVWRLFPSKLTNWIYSKIRNYNEQNVLFASGACILLRTKDFIAIDGYDPLYFLTVEDVCDLCIRLRKISAATNVVIIPSATITHLKSRSAITMPFITLWHGAHGSIYHFKKHHGNFVGWLAFFIVYISIFIRTLSSGIRSPFNKLHRKRFEINKLVLKKLIIENPLLKERK